jgi:hypothetical protein
MNCDVCFTPESGHLSATHNGIRLAVYQSTPAHIIALIRFRSLLKAG